MTYWGTAILILFLLALTSGGWYFLFKRFERRMSYRMDDLVARSEETLKSFADVLELAATGFREQSELSQELAERVQKVKLDAEAILTELEKADKKLDLAQGIELVIKQDRFLDYARALGKSYHDRGEIDEQLLDRLERLLDEMKLENYSRY